MRGFSLVLRMEENRAMTKPEREAETTDETQTVADKPARYLDPLLMLRGSGKHIWADEHADEYVANLRKDWD